MSVDELKEFSEDLENLGSIEPQPISDVIGVVFEEGSPWRSLRVGELKAMLALAMGDLEEAARWCYWCHGFDYISAPRQRLYRVLYDVIGFELSHEKPANYHPSLKKFFGDEVVSKARQIVDGDLTFDGLHFADSWEEVSPAHSTLLSLYNKLLPLKMATCTNSDLYE